ncbi:MAG TPA: hypothetical protein DCE52_18800, partial [Rhodobacteraceae bacterium]|nr:hypothetical protein [Paracoccaceae bacterium]
TETDVISGISTTFDKFWKVTASSADASKLEAIAADSLNFSLASQAFASELEKYDSYSLYFNTTHFDSEQDEHGNVWENSSHEIFVESGGVTSSLGIVNRNYNESEHWEDSDRIWWNENYSFNTFDWQEVSNVGMNADGWVWTNSYIHDLKGSGDNEEYYYYTQINTNTLYETTLITEQDGTIDTEYVTVDGERVVMSQDLSNYDYKYSNYQIDTSGQVLERDMWGEFLGGTQQQGGMIITFDENWNRVSETATTAGATVLDSVADADNIFFGLDATHVHTRSWENGYEKLYVKATVDGAADIIGRENSWGSEWTDEGTTPATNYIQKGFNYEVYEDDGDPNTWDWDWIGGGKVTYKGTVSDDNLVNSSSSVRQYTESGYTEFQTNYDTREEDGNSVIESFEREWYWVVDTNVEQAAGSQPSYIRTGGIERDLISGTTTTINFDGSRSESIDLTKQTAVTDAEIIDYASKAFGIPSTDDIYILFDDYDDGGTQGDTTDDSFFEAKVYLDDPSNPAAGKQVGFITRDYQSLGSNDTNSDQYEVTNPDEDNAPAPETPTSSPMMSTMGDSSWWEVDYRFNDVEWQDLGSIRYDSNGDFESVSYVHEKTSNEVNQGELFYTRVREVIEYELDEAGNVTQTVKSKRTWEEDYKYQQDDDTSGSTASTLRMGGERLGAREMNDGVITVYDKDYNAISQSATLDGVKPLTAQDYDALPDVVKTILNDPSVTDDLVKTYYSESNEFGRVERTYINASLLDEADVNTAT